MTHLPKVGGLGGKWRWSRVASDTIMRMVGYMVTRLFGGGPLSVKSENFRPKPHTQLLGKNVDGSWYGRAAVAESYNFGWFDQGVFYDLGAPFELPKANLMNLNHYSCALSAIRRMVAPSSIKAAETIALYTRPARSQRERRQMMDEALWLGRQKHTLSISVLEQIRDVILEGWEVADYAQKGAGSPQDYMVAACVLDTMGRGDGGSKLRVSATRGLNVIHVPESSVYSKWPIRFQRMLLRDTYAEMLTNEVNGLFIAPNRTLLPPQAMS